MRSKRYLQLPHGYLSYSQMSLWGTDRTRYMGLYFDKREDLRVSNRGQEYGKLVANALEKEEETGDLLTDSAMLLLPKYDIRDVGFDVEIKTKDGWLKLIAKPDYMDSQTKNFIEIKTGRYPWTQAKAQSHLQMIFYAVVIWQKYDIKLPGAKLAWIETDYTDEGLKPTGRVETFEVTFTSSQYLETLSEMIRVAKEIEIAWASHVTKPYITTF